MTNGWRFLILFLISFTILICARLAFAATPSVTFSWTYDPAAPAPKGFRIHKGTSAADMLPVADLPATARSWSYSFVDSTPQCFGVQAFTDIGVSVIVTSQDDGTPVCLGKPVAPRGFSFKVQ